MKIDFYNLNYIYIYKVYYKRTYLFKNTLFINFNDIIINSFNY